MRPDLKNRKVIFLITGIFLVAIISLVIYLQIGRSIDRTKAVIAFIRNPEFNNNWVIEHGSRCKDSVFSFPSTGVIGYIWGDSFRLGHIHQGIDIFGGTAPGVTPVFAAHDGFLTRKEEWKSSLIIRIPQDPLNPDRQIWTYYTHLADSNGISSIEENFPPGSYEVPVGHGDLLGFQGNYSGNPGNPVGVHLHFSIVKDDGKGMFLNELEIENTIDPSPYFNLPLNYEENPDQIPLCEPIE